MEPTGSQIIVPDSTELQKMARTVIASANAIQLIDADSYIEAGIFRDDCMARIQKAEMLFRPSIQQADKLHKELLRLLNLCSGSFIEAAKILKSKMIAYDVEQKRLAELKRIELERQEREKAEKEILEVAELLEKSGSKIAAEELLSEPIKPISVSVKPDTPKIEGFSYRSIWKFRVVDETKIPREFLIADEKKIGAVVRAMKQGTSIPGIEVFEEKV